MGQRITLQYPPTATKTGGAYFKDEDGVLNFGDSSLLTLQQRDVIEAERTHNPPKGKFNASFTINSWKPAEPISEPQKQFTRPRTDPHDSLQIFMTALLKEWMTAYSATLMISADQRKAPDQTISEVTGRSINPEQRMAPINATTVLQAMEALTVAYRRYHGDRTQSGADIQEPPKQRQDMNDGIPEHAR